MENCYNTGLVTGLDNNQTFARWGTTNGVIELSNCYETIGSQVSYISSEKIASGELCYRLNGSQSEEPIWYQTLGMDNHPVLDSAHGIVYYNEAYNLYSNTEQPQYESIANVSASEPADVYSLQGHKMRSKAISLKGLPKGVYIVNGKKTILK